MLYEDSIDDSRLYLRLALEKLGTHGLPTDPLNYCVWYEYCTGRNETLKTTIDRFLEEKGVFSPQILRQLYTQFIADGQDRVNSLVRDGLKKVFTEIVAAIHTTHDQFSQSGTNLGEINDVIVPSLSEAEVAIIVDRIKKEIQDIEETNGSFKDQLNKATREIDQLKAKMVHYRTEARKDPLTRIDNRRGFDQKLKEAIRQSQAEQTSLCLVMADIDHFKAFNDNHGHLVGDNVIRMVAATIKDSIKGKDLVARIGGEEFAILLPDTPMEGARTLAENMRASFERLDLKKKTSGESLGKITLSFGVTAYREGEEDESFLQRADEAMYRSKRTGRNRVTPL